jgi:hypothetical protein
MVLQRNFALNRIGIPNLVDRVFRDSLLPVLLFSLHLSHIKDGRLDCCPCDALPGKSPN